MQKTLCPELVVVLGYKKAGDHVRDNNALEWLVWFSLYGI